MRYLAVLLVLVGLACIGDTQVAPSDFKQQLDEFGRRAYLTGYSDGQYDQSCAILSKLQPESFKKVCNRYPAKLKFPEAK